MKSLRLRRTVRATPLRAAAAIQPYAAATLLALFAATAVAYTPEPAAAAPESAAPESIESPATLQRAAERAVALRAGSAAAAMTARADPLDARLRLAACGQPLVAMVSGDGQLRAQTTVGIRCEGPIRWTIYLNVQTESESQVLIARRNLSRDTELTAADFELSSRTVPGIITDYVTDLSMLKGQRLRRPVAAGAALSLDALTPANLIHRGQQVVLVARSGSVEVRMAAVALADGRAAERIQVQNISSQRVVEAIVRSDNEVEAPL